MLYFEKLFDTPLKVRVIPFILFILLTAGQGALGEGSRYWVYALKTGLGASLLLLLRPRIEEMRWKLSLEGVLCGLVVFALWVGLDNLYPKIGSRQSPWNPIHYFAGSAALGWIFVAVRIAGSSLVVPPLEEVFFRSFVYRYVVRQDFMSVSLGDFHAKAFAITVAVFGFEHAEWLAGLASGIVFQALVLWRRRLGDAITAHAIANLLLGLWVVGKGEWHFW